MGHEHVGVGDASRHDRQGHPSLFGAGLLVIEQAPGPGEPSAGGDRVPEGLGAEASQPAGGEGGLRRRPPASKARSAASSWALASSVAAGLP